MHVDGCSFHQTVRLDEFDSHRILRLCPSQGEVNLSHHIRTISHRTEHVGKNGKIAQTISSGFHSFHFWYGHTSLTMWTEEVWCVLWCSKKQLRSQRKACTKCFVFSHSPQGLWKLPLCIHTHTIYEYTQYMKTFFSSSSLCLVPVAANCDAVPAEWRPALCSAFPPVPNNREG